MVRSVKWTVVILQVSNRFLALFSRIKYSSFVTATLILSVLRSLSNVLIGNLEIPSSLNIFNVREHDFISSLELCKYLHC